MFIEGELNFSFDDIDNLSEHAYPLNPTASNSGKYNSGFEYKIVPLVHNLSQKGNDSELQRHNADLYANDINIFDTVSGKAFKDSKEHTGIVTYITYKDDCMTPKYIWILDNADKKKYALYPKSCEIQKSKNASQYKRINPFSTNYMHLHEGRDIFSDEELKYDDIEEQKGYRYACINKYNFLDNYIDAFDDILMYKKYEPKKIIIKCFDAYSFNLLLGLDRDDKNAVLKYIKVFIKHYCNLTDRQFDKSIKLQYNGGSYVYMKNWIQYANMLSVSSWEDIYMMIVAFMYTYNQVIHSYDYKPKRGSAKEEVSFNPKNSRFKTWLKLFICHTLEWDFNYWDDINKKYINPFKKDK